jgi:hypothetical protein
MTTEGATVETVDGPVTFKDTEGRAWSVEITYSTVKRVRSILGVDIMEAVEGKLMPKLISDPMLLVDVLYCIVKPQADAAGVTDEQFGGALGSGKLYEARDCLAHALVFFSPPEKRQAIRRAWERTKDLVDTAAAAVVKRMDDPEIDREIAAIVMAGRLPLGKPGNT